MTHARQRQFRVRADAFGTVPARTAARRMLRDSAASFAHAAKRHFPALTRTAPKRPRSFQRGKRHRAGIQPPRGRPPGFDRYRAAEPAAIRCRTFSHGKRPSRHPDCPAPQTSFRLLHQKAVQLARRGEKRCTIARQLRKTMYSPRADLFRSLLFGKGSSACGRTLSVKPLCARPACAYSAGGRHAFTFSAISR